MQPELVDIGRHAERAVPEEAPSILAEGLVAHIGFVHQGVPQVIPVNYQYDPAEPSSLYLHGGHESRMVQALAEGARACVTVTIVDGLVFSKTHRSHSNNYRSVICYGCAQLVEDTAKKASIFDAMTARYFPGRTSGRDYEPATVADLEATAVLEFHIDAWSAKARRGGPQGPHDSDDSFPGTCGVVSLDSGTRA
jgi:nitroimidazol reductase NimA-like FMN-containing flavoprotein (pyridoxamine 5'-phosphate oxidase superfamily)